MKNNCNTVNGVYNSITAHDTSINDNFFLFTTTNIGGRDCVSITFYTKLYKNVTFYKIQQFKS